MEVTEIIYYKSVYYFLGAKVTKILKCMFSLNPQEKVHWTTVLLRTY